MCLGEIDLVVAPEIRFLGHLDLCEDPASLVLIPTDRLDVQDHVPARHGEMQGRVSSFDTIVQGPSLR